MSDLLSRLQALTGPDREIDAEIALANGWERDPFPRLGDPYLHSPDGSIRSVPHFTASIDAALTLLPANVSKSKWKMGFSITGYGYAMVNDGPYCEANSPAIALLIAIMKAKEAAKREMEETK